MSGRPTLECAKRNSGPGAGSGVTSAIGICTQSFLFVGSHHDGSWRSPIDVPTITRVELVRSPRSTEVHALVDGHRIRPDRTELHAYVCHLGNNIIQTVLEYHVRKGPTAHSPPNSL